MEITKEAFDSLALWTEDLRKTSEKLLALVAGFGEDNYDINEVDKSFRTKYPTWSPPSGPEDIAKHGPLGDPGFPKELDEMTKNRILDTHQCYKLREEVIIAETAIYKAIHLLKTQ